MAEYRRKPIVVQAMEYTGDRMAVAEFLDGRAPWEAEEAGAGIYISVPEGEHFARVLASVGDWIVQGAGGEFYPVRPGTFEATYEPA